MLTLPVALVGFVAAAAVVAAAGVALTVRAEHLARVTGLGQAIMGAVFIGITTSLAGTVTSATAAFLGSAALAASNSIGGIAAQTVFLALADMVYRKANLEHAAASEANLQQSALLIVMLSIPLIGFALPELTIGWVHPVSPLLVVVYLSGVHLVNRAFREPMWRPRLTRETEQEPPRDRSGQRATARDWLGFLALAAVVAVAGWVIAECGVALSARLGLRSRSWAGCSPPSRRPCRSSWWRSRPCAAARSRSRSGTSSEGTPSTCCSWPSPISAISRDRSTRRWGAVSCCGSP